MSEALNSAFTAAAILASTHWRMRHIQDVTFSHQFGEQQAMNRFLYVGLTVSSSFFFSHAN